MINIFFEIASKRFSFFSSFVRLFVCLVHDFRFVAVLPNLNLKTKGLDKQIMLTVPEVNVLTFSVKVRSNNTLVYASQETFFGEILIINKKIIVLSKKYLPS